MMQLFLIYQWTLLAGALASIVLAWVGSQLSARQQSVQVLVVSEASVVGILLGVFLGTLWGHSSGEIVPSMGGAALLVEQVFLLLPSGLGFVLAALSYLACVKWLRGAVPARPAFLIGIYAVCIAVVSLLVALAPGLETHMAAGYMGDLALASTQEVQILLVLALVLGGFITVAWRQITHRSFQEVVLQTAVYTPAEERWNRIFIASAVLLITVSVQALGLLFTLAALILPGLCFTRGQTSLRRYQWNLALCASISTVLGFVLSLWHGSLPTVPVIVVCMLVVGAAIGYGQRRWRC